MMTTLVVNHLSVSLLSLPVFLSPSLSFCLGLSLPLHLLPPTHPFLFLCPSACLTAQVPADEVCGCPLVKDVFEPTGEFCRVSKRKCNKHYCWEKLRRAEVDLERVRVVRSRQEIKRHPHQREDRRPESNPVCLSVRLSVVQAGRAVWAGEEPEDGHDQPGRFIGSDAAPDHPARPNHNGPALCKGQVDSKTGRQEDSVEANVDRKRNWWMKPFLYVFNVSVLMKQRALWEPEASHHIHQKTTHMDLITTVRQCYEVAIISVWKKIPICESWHMNDENSKIKKSPLFCQIYPIIYPRTSIFPLFAGIFNIYYTTQNPPVTELLLWTLAPLQLHF